MPHPSHVFSGTMCVLARCLHPMHSMILDRIYEALHGSVYAGVCVRNWSCLSSVCVLASLISVGGTVLFVLAPGLAPLKCWLAAMTQRYSTREGTNRREQVREKEVLRLSPLSQCATRPGFFLSPLPQTDRDHFACQCNNIQGVF